MANEEEVKKVEETVSDETKVETEQDPELKKKEEKKANIDKAILEAEEILRKKRAEIKEVKTEKTEEESEEENLPKFDEADPNVKAWDKRIKNSTAPISTQFEKQKAEVRTFALRKFLADKPALAKSPEKLKEFMSIYDRIKTSTEQTQEGVLMDFDKAYGATFHEELTSAARGARIDQAKEDMIASDIAVDKGSTSESSRPTTKRKLSAEEQKIVDTWEVHGAPKV